MARAIRTLGDALLSLQKQKSTSAEQVENLQREIEDLHNKVQFLIDGLHLADHAYAFPDGDTWYQTGYEPAKRKPR